MHALTISDHEESAALDSIAEIGEIERCVTCGWWCEMIELEIVDDEYHCEDCRQC